MNGARTSPTADPERVWRPDASSGRFDAAHHLAGTTPACMGVVHHGARGPTLAPPPPRGKMLAPTLGQVGTGGHSSAHAPRDAGAPAAGGTASARPAVVGNTCGGLAAPAYDAHDSAPCDAYSAAARSSRARACAARVHPGATSVSAASASAGGAAAATTCAHVGTHSVRPVSTASARGGRAHARGGVSARGAEVGTVTVRTATGPHTLPPSRFVLDHASDAPPTCAHPERLAPFLSTALRLMAFVPKTSELKLAGAIERFASVIAFWGIETAAVTWHIVVAYVSMRCAPPVGVLLPPCCTTPVMPATAAGDVDALRRSARLGLAGLQACREALESERVSLLLRAISARVKRLRTAKRALLFVQVCAFWHACVKIGTPIAIRDGFAVLVAFFFAMRVRELLALLPDDVEPVHLRDGRVAMRITFRTTKTRQSVFSTHDPFVVSCAHDFLISAWHVFEQHIDYYDDVPVFHALRGATRDPLSRAWFASVVSRAAPNVTPHSCRVGCASEMWAARVPLSEIMAHGRWTSIAAVLYIVGSLEDQVAASDAIGSKGALVYRGDDLRKVGLGGFDPQAEVDGERWAAIVASLPIEQE